VKELIMECGDILYLYLEYSGREYIGLFVINVYE